MEQIRADGIDILVDLAGHTSQGRLKVFALKPAPVQVSYLGYPNTTGLTAIDYRLTDAVADPPGEPNHYVEELIRLPRAFCYLPPAAAPAVSPSPVAKSGQITFGSFHNLAKLNDRLLDLWCAVLQAVPTARLRLFRHTLQGRTRDYFHKQLTDRGILPERFDLTQRAGQPEASARLRTSGYRSGCISVEWSHDRVRGGVDGSSRDHPLWRSLRRPNGGQHADGIGLAELIAHSPKEFVSLAADWSGDIGRLVRWRAELRERMRSSALCDGKSFTRDLERAYRELWQVLRVPLARTATHEPEGKRGNECFTTPALASLRVGIVQGRVFDSERLRSTMRTALEEIAQAHSPGQPAD